MQHLPTKKFAFGKYTKCLSVQRLILVAIASTSLSAEVAFATSTTVDKWNKKGWFSILIHPYTILCIYGHIYIYDINWYHTSYITIIFDISIRRFWSITSILFSPTWLDREASPGGGGFYTCFPNFLEPLWICNVSCLIYHTVSPEKHVLIITTHIFKNNRFRPL